MCSPPTVGRYFHPSQPRVSTALSLAVEGNAIGRWGDGKDVCGECIKGMKKGEEERKEDEYVERKRGENKKQV